MYDLLKKQKYKPKLRNKIGSPIKITFSLF